MVSPERRKNDLSYRDNFMYATPFTDAQSKFEKVKSHLANPLGQYKQNHQLREE